jgi:signal transduction histidine kinase
MALTPQNAAVALLCRSNATLTEVIYDEIGLPPRFVPGSDFTALAVASNLRKATRFLRTIHASRSALDWELNIKLPHGITSLFFSGCVIEGGLVIIGTKEALTASPLPDPLLAASETAPSNFKQAITDLSIRREARVSSQRILTQKLSQLEQFLARTQSEAADSSLPARKIGSKQIRILEMAAHDLRNPVSGVLAASQFLLEDAAPRLEEHQIALLRSIGASSRLMLRLLEDMLEIPSIDSSGMKMYFQVTDIRSLVEQSVAMIRPLAEPRRVRIEVSADAEVPTLAADPVRMSQALHDLLASAIRWSQFGGKVTVSVSARREYAVVSIVNENPESAAEAMKHLLAPVDLRRLKGGLAEARTALTLASVKRTIDAHRGVIQSDCGVDKEATVTVMLPISRRARPGAAQDPKRHQAHGGK